MAWTGITRREHSRDGLRYPSDLTDREWALTAPFIPPAKSGGRRRTTDSRADVRMAGQVSTIGQGLGAFHRLINHTGTHSINPNAHTPDRKVLLCLMNF